MEPGLDIFAALDSSALKKRGTLYAWMVENQAAFAERLRTIKPDWPVLAKMFADAGLLDTRGNPPTGEATRKTWQRVKGPVRTKHARTKASAESTSHQPTANDHTPSARPPSGAWVEGSLIGHTPSTKSPASDPAPSPKPDPDRLKREMARLLGNNPPPDPDGA